MPLVCITVTVQITAHDALPASISKLTHKSEDEGLSRLVVLLLVCKPTGLGLSDLALAAGDWISLKANRFSIRHLYHLSDQAVLSEDWARWLGSMHLL